MGKQVLYSYWISVCLSRLFETGSYQGYFETYGRDALMNYVEIPDGKVVQSIHAVNVYTDWDIAAWRENRLKLKNAGM